MCIPLSKVVDELRSCRHEKLSSCAYQLPDAHIDMQVS